MENGSDNHNKSGHYRQKQENEVFENDAAFSMKEIEANPPETSDIEKSYHPKLEDDGHGSVLHPTTYGETLMHLLRGNLATGLFAMGDAFKNAGILVAPVGLIVIAVLCLHCQHILLTAAVEVQARMDMGVSPGFAQTVELSFAESKLSIARKSAWVMRSLINFFLCVTQLGFNCIHIVFISTNVKQVCDYYNFEVDIHILMALVVIPILATCMIRNLKRLTPFSTFANVVMLAGVIITLYFLLRKLPPIYSRKYVADLADFPLFFGTALYGFEGIGLVLPLQREMKEPKKFGGALGVLNVGTSIVIVILVIMGFLSFLKYGDDIEGSVTVNLPPDEVLSQVVKLMVPLGVLFTYALQFYIPIGIMWPQVLKKVGPFKNPIRAELLFRTAMVLVTFTLAEVIPYLSLFISLVGAVSSAALALLFPPLLELAVTWGTPRLSPLLFVKNFTIFLIGILGCITGTYQSISAIVDAISNDE